MARGLKTLTERAVHEQIHRRSDDNGQLATEQGKGKEFIHLQIRPIQRGLLTLKIVGLSPLMTNRFSEEAQRQITVKQGAKEDQDTIGELKPRIPVEIAGAARHLIPKFGKWVEVSAWPGGGIKRALVETLRQVDAKGAGKLTMVTLKSLMYATEDLIPILLPDESGPAPWILDSRPVKIPNGPWTMAHRPKFLEWSLRFSIDFNRTKLSRGDLINLVRIAGEAGIGCFSVSRGGTFGRFGVDGNVDYSERDI